MFTGLVETIGTISQYTAEGDSIDVTVSDCLAILGDVCLGDSIATNGVCLTVTAFDDLRLWFTVGVAQETIRRTTLGSLKPGSRVNLERAVTPTLRLGGHSVQGHVDTVARLVEKQGDGDAIAFTFELRDPEYMRFIVEKGFIAVDGTLLTITSVDYVLSRFSIMMVKYTQMKVIMPLKEVGDYINVEVDLAGKLVAQQIESTLAGQANDPNLALVKLVTRIVEDKMGVT